MLAITCDKCRRRFTATDEELRTYLQQAEGKKYAQVLCPHCGKASKIAENRIHQGLRFSQPAEGQSQSQQDQSAGEIASTGSVPEEENPPA